MIIFLSFLFLSCAFISLWIKKSPKIWGPLLGLSLLLGYLSGHLDLMGMAITLGWMVAWFLYAKEKKGQAKALFFAGFILFSFGFRFHLFPGYIPLQLTQKFWMGLSTPLMGFFPLAYIVPLARKAQEWKQVLRGTLWGVLGIGALATLAIISHSVYLNLGIPTYPEIRYPFHLLFIAMPEEAFYRGFMQRTFTQYLVKIKGGAWLSIFLTSLFFTLAHVFWSPSFGILAFVFLASLLYGWVYHKSQRVESAIFTHFLLNVMHMTFFSYHAL